MVICRFFLQGLCRFGTKCNNEHLDIKQLVKSDLEAALNGKQWPFSCFGPFKDKPCVPNFIEDQSFEEIRFLCYEAKQKNMLEQYVQYFSKEAIEANNKMKTMLQLSPQDLDLVCRLYDTESHSVGNNGLLKSNANNPFGLGNSGTKEASSIFSKTNPPACANTSISGFSNPVSSNNTANVFGSLASPVNSIFGGGGSAFIQNSQPSGFSQQNHKTNSMFGGGSSQNGLFGQSQISSSNIGSHFGQTSKAGNSLFGQQQQIQPSVNTSLFGQQAQQTPSVPNGGIFTQHPAQSGGSIFKQNVPQNAGNLFSQAAQSQLFQESKQQAPSVFVQQNAFAQKNSNLFSEMAPTAPINGTHSMFGQIANTNGIFSNTNATSMPIQNMFTQQQVPTNIFSQPDQTSAAIANTMQASVGFFQQSTQSSHLTKQQSFGQQTIHNPPIQIQSSVECSSVYSKLEDLTPEDIEAFKADTFVSGRIPNVPPPLEFIS